MDEIRLVDADAVWGAHGFRSREIEVSEADKLFAEWKAASNGDANRLRDATGKLMAWVHEHARRYVKQRIARGWPDEIEDQANEAYTRVLAGLPDFREEAPFENWAHRVFKHTVADFLRKALRRRKREEVGALDLEVQTDSAPGPEEQTEEAEEYKPGSRTQLMSKCQKVIDDLADNQRAQSVLIASLEYHRLCTIRTPSLPLRRTFIDDDVGLKGIEQQTAVKLIRRRFEAFAKECEDRDFLFVYKLLFPTGRAPKTALGVALWNTTP